MGMGQEPIPSGSPRVFGDVLSPDVLALTAVWLTRAIGVDGRAVGFLVRSRLELARRVTDEGACASDHVTLRRRC